MSRPGCGRPMSAPDGWQRVADQRILFVTSNGSGLGHLTRGMAVARRLAPGTEAVFATMSRAAPTVAELGFDVEYIPSASTPGAGAGWGWNLRLRRRLEQLIDDLDPDLAVFDGVHPYRGLTHVLTARRALTTVWCRRPMWRPDADDAALARSRAFTLVIEPGELAAAADRGPRPRHDAEVFRLPPMVFCRQDELLGREAAARELGLDPARPAALIALGQGAGLRGAIDAALERLSRIDGLQVALLESALAGETRPLPPQVIRLRGVFPIARYMRAFDFGVVAAGYNAFHETLAARLPALFIPMERLTDDQAARAGWAARQGYGVSVSGPSDPSIPEMAESLARPEVREPLERALAGLEIPDGAARMALELEALARGHSGGAAPGRLERWLRLSAHPVGPSLPWAAAVTANELRRSPRLRRPKLAIAAFGLEGADLASAVAAARDEAIEPERTLVVTDARLFGELARLGFGIERLPDPDQAERLYPTRDYGELITSRLRVALAGRRPRRALAVTDAPVAVLEALRATGARAGTR